MKLSSRPIFDKNEQAAPWIVAAVAGAALTITLYYCKRQRRRSAVAMIEEATEDKVVLITGCDPGGFGELLTRRALDVGYTVVAACYTHDGAASLVRTTSAITVVADLMTKEGRMRVVEVTKRACELRGGLYAIVNNAGVAYPGNVDWLLPKYYEDSMNLNFHAPVEITYELLPLLKRKGGRVINVTSVDGFITLPTNAAYNASKHALESFSDCLRVEMIPWDVKVVVCEPSTMRTPLVLSFADRYRETFLAAPPDRQAQYGIEWIHEVHDSTTKGLMDAAMDPNETADDLLRALRLKNPPTRIASGAAAKYLFKPVSWLPDRARDRVLFNGIVAKHPTPQALAVPRPPVNKISHVSIRVSNLERAVGFYKKFGFETVDKPFDGQQFLKGGGHKFWKPLVLLVEDPTMPPRSNCYDIGMTRLCISSTNVDKDVEVLKSEGLETTYRIAEDSMAKIASYKDPDGFCIYLIQFKHVIGLCAKWLEYTHEVSQPWLFHWTVNVHDSAKVNGMLAKIGFKAMSDQNKNQVGEGLLPAFGLTGDETVIEHIRLQNLSDDHFVATTMEWRKPESRKTGQEISNALSISVENVEKAMEDAKAAGMIVTEGIKSMTLPYYGNVRFGTAHLEGNSNRIDFVEF